MALETRDCLLTTADNPFDPFIQDEDWRGYDRSHGYYTDELLARIMRIGPNMSDPEINQERSYAIDDIMRLTPFANGNPNALYVKVYEGDTHAKRS